jgi:hypothetical protein
MPDKIRLTTTDNPYNPFKDWDSWYFYDMSQGYNTCERIARASKTSYQISDELNNDEIEEAMNQLIDVGAISKDGKIVGYKKVYSSGS